mgnify:CR=1 FL=1|tara:strand:+ start:386 stop:1108 length:723 start_codon:yes stop_codon:yes gene_type:complete
MENLETLVNRPISSSNELPGPQFNNKLYAVNQDGAIMVWNSNKGTWDSVRSADGTDTSNMKQIAFTTENRAIGISTSGEIMTMVISGSTISNINSCGKTLGGQAASFFSFDSSGKLWGVLGPEGKVGFYDFFSWTYPSVLSAYKFSTIGVLDQGSPLVGISQNTEEMIVLSKGIVDNGTNGGHVKYLQMEFYIDKTGIVDAIGCGIHSVQGEEYSFVSAGSIFNNLGRQKIKSVAYNPAG